MNIEQAMQYRRQRYASWNKGNHGLSRNNDQGANRQLAAHPQERQLPAHPQESSTHCHAADQQMVIFFFSRNAK